MAYYVLHNYCIVLLSTNCLSAFTVLYLSTAVEIAVLFGYVYVYLLRITLISLIQDFFCPLLLLIRCQFQTVI